MSHGKRHWLLLAISLLALMLLFMAAMHGATPARARASAPPSVLSRQCRQYSGMSALLHLVPRL